MSACDTKRVGEDTKNEKKRNLKDKKGERDRRDRNTG